MSNDTAWDVLKKYFVLTIISVLVIKLTGGKGWIGFTEIAVMNLLILYMLHRPIMKVMFENATFLFFFFL